MKCRRCGSDNAGGMKFCGECGAPLALPATGLAPIDGDRGPPVVADGGAPGDGAASGERKLVTVLFADISGFTTLAETLDPEPLRDLVNACFDRLVPCIERYGGTVDKFIGDEVMALFGAPVAHDNDAERALRAALDMLTALVAFNAERGTALQAHFGLNTGLVLAGTVGSAGHADYSVMGDAVNVASRLAEAAAPGEILAGADTYRLAGHLFACEEAGSVRVRGRTQAFAAHRVLGPAEAAGAAVAASARWVGSPLVGRDVEKQTFMAALDRAIQGEGGILAVVGDAGLGKSRLTAEVRRPAGPELRWLEGRALSFGRELSYWPFLELVQGAAGIDADDGEQERSAKLAALVERLFGKETPDVLPYLATFLALPVPEELQDKVRYLDGEAMGRQVFRTMRLFFGRLAQERPLVLVFEDVHWLDDSSVELLEHLLPLTRGLPVLFCLVGRPDPGSPTPRLQTLAQEACGDRYGEILLGPLSADETRALTRNLVGLRELPVGLRDAIDHRAEGNPFFVEEVVRAMIDLGGLAPAESGGWTMTHRASHLTIPDTLAGVIVARIDRLDEELKAVLRLAAVVGRSFFYRVLAALAETESQLDQDLLRLESLELIREKAREPELEYIFKHALVQEATYESILLQRRKELHLKVAETTERLFAGRLDEFYGLLAYHYTKAEDWAKAQDYLLKAGDQAGRIAADAEALAHYERAMEAHAQAFGDTWDPFERAVLERKIGEALYRQGELERAREHLYRAMALLGHPLARPGADVRRTLARQALRQLGHRVVPRRPRREPSDEQERVLNELLALYGPLYWTDFMQETEKALLDTLLLLNVFEQAGFERGIGKLSGGLSPVAQLLPVLGYRVGLSYIHRSLAAARRTGDRDTLAEATFWLAGHDLMLSMDRVTVRERYAEAAELRLVLGDIRRWGMAVGMACNLLLEMGELEETVSLASTCVLRGQESGDPLVQAWGEVCRGDALYRMGRLTEAESDLRAGFAGILGANELLNVPRTIGPLAQCLLKQGRTDEAAELIDGEFARPSAVDTVSHFRTPLWSASAALRLQRLEMAHEGREVARSAAEHACRGLLRNSRTDKGGYAPGYRYLGTYEWLCGHERKARRAWEKSLAVAAEVGARYHEAQTRLEMGRRLGDRAELEQAEVLFADMGAAVDLAEARRLLGKGTDQPAGRAATPDLTLDEIVQPAVAAEGDRS